MANDLDDIEARVREAIGQTARYSASEAKYES